MSVKVSVCIPVYGVEKYIEKCARSLFEQTMQDGLELVFVNDCTPDKSIEILEQVLSEYPNRKALTKIINLPENGGVGRARRIAIENCTGEYIIHCDPDDWVELDMYEKMYHAAKEADADMVYCDYVREMPDGKSLEEKKNNEIFNVDEYIIASIERKVMVALWNHLYKQSIAQKDCSTFCPDSIGYGEDLMRNLFMLNRTKKIIKIKENLYHYRCTSNSITNNINIKSLQSMIQTQKILEDHFSDKKFIVAVNSHRVGVLRHTLPYYYEKSIRKEIRNIYSQVFENIFAENYFSFRAKLFFLIGYINIPLTSYIYRKVKGIK